MTSFKVKQGDTWTFSVQWLNPIPGTQQPDPANPVDLTGYTAKLQVRRQAGDSAVLTLTSSPPAGLTVTALDGRIDGRASPVQTGAIDPGTYRWEVEVNNSVDNWTLDEGTLVITRQVST